MIQLCIDARMLFASGIGTYLRNILFNFEKQPELSITLIVQSSSKEFLKERLFKTAICDVPIYSVQEQLVLPCKIPKCDVFWSPHYNIPLLPIQARKRVVTIHDVCHLVHGDSLSFIQKKYASLMLRQAVFRSDAVCTVSRFSQQEIVRCTGADQEKIIWSHEGVDKDFFSPSNPLEAAQHIQKKYGIHRPYILYVGNFKPHKNIHRLLEAYHFLRTKHTEHDLVLVGKRGKDGCIEKAMQCHEGNSPHVKILENVSDEDLADFYRAARVFILPSLYEGFGLPPLEAMGCLCPVVVSKAASLPEVCGDAALYVDPQDAQSIAHGLLQVLEDSSLREVLIENGKQKVIEYSWKKAADNMLEVLKMVCAS
jgi:glycosyltransferase involved in cell wall biosynthesis